MSKFIFQAILTPEEEGGYSVEFPDLPGCFSCGDTFNDAVAMGADAAKTYVASLLGHGEAVPEPQRHRCPSGAEDVMVFFETDPSYIVEGDVVSAAEASRMLGVSAGRITHMLDAGVLDGYREGRRTWVSVASIEKRLSEVPKAGRPRKAQMA